LTQPARVTVLVLARQSNRPVRLEFTTAGPVMAVACAADRGQARVGVHMARARAVAQFADGVVRPGTVGFPVFPLPVIIGMTAGALGAVPGIFPRNGLVVGGVAVDALCCGAMVTGVIRGIVSEQRHWHPASAVMAALAAERCDEMIRWFAGCGDTVVAAAAKSGDVVVVKAGAGPGDGRMAGVALGGGLDMAGWLAGRGGAVVAAAARRGDAAVIEPNRVPVDGAMAVIALRTGLKVSRRLAGRGEAVMARITYADRRVMVHTDCTSETDGVVAILACRGAENMVRWLSGRNTAVMAVRACADRVAVVEARAGPRVHGMTVIAEVAARDMLRVFSGGPAFVMTQSAFQRCARELAADVAAGTVDVFMPSRQWKTGGEMVECVRGVQQAGYRDGQHPDSCKFARQPEGHGQAGGYVAVNVHERLAACAGQYRMLTSWKFSLPWQRPQSRPNWPSCLSWLRWQKTHSFDDLSAPDDFVAWQS